MDALLTDSALNEPSAGKPPQLPGYDIVNLLGQGGMGMVWRARQRSTNRIVALKILAGEMVASPQAVARFTREVQLAARLQHPHIAGVYDSGLERGVRFYAMEFVEGLHLHEYVQAHHLKDRDIAALMLKVARAVQHAHERGVIHRDLKPSNILVTPDGQPHVLDFGLAKAQQSDADASDGGTVTPPAEMELSLAGSPIGTLAYMSPEQAAGQGGQVDTRSDVYALGVVLYRLLTNRMPHDATGTQYQRQRRIIETDALRPRKVRPDLDADLEALLLKALSRESAERYHNAGALADDLANYLAGDPVRARKLTVPYVLGKRFAQHRGRYLALLAVLLVLAATLVTAVVKINDARQRAEHEAQVAREALYQNRLALARSEISRGDIAQAWQSLEACEADLRRWEWHRLRYLADQSEVALEGLDGRVTSLAFSPDGGQVVAVNHRQQLALWDARDGRLLHHLEMGDGSVAKVRLSPDGGLAVIARGNEVELWNTATRKRVDAHTLAMDGITAVALDENGRHVIAGDRTGLGVVWGWPGWQVETRWQSPQAIMCITMQGGRWVLASSESRLEVIDLHGQHPPGSLPLDHRLALAAILREEGQSVLAGSREEGMGLWPVDGSTARWQRRPQTHEPTGMAWDDIGDRLALVDEAGCIEIIEPSTGETLATLHGNRGGGESIAWSHDGSRLASADGSGVIRIWSLPASLVPEADINSRVAWSATQPVKAISNWSGDGRVVIGEEDGQVVIVSRDSLADWKDSRRQESRPVIDIAGENIVVAALSADAKVMALGTGEGIVEVRDAAAGTLVSRLGERDKTVYGLALGEAGKWLAVSMLDGSEPGTLVYRFEEGGKPRRLAVAGPLAPRPDGLRLAGGAHDAVIFWDTATWNETRRLATPAQVVALAWSAQGASLAAALADGRVLVWDFDRVEPRMELLPDAGAVISALAFVGDGSRLMTAGTDLALWDTHNGACLLRTPHQGYVRGLHFDPQAQTIYYDTPDALMALPAR